MVISGSVLYIAAVLFFWQRHDVSSASFTRHSMAKVVYARLFDWLVWRINESHLTSFQALVGAAWMLVQLSHESRPAK